MTNHPNRSKQQQAKHTPLPVPTTKDLAAQEPCGCIHGLSPAGTPRLQFCRAHKVAPETAAERDRLKALNAELLAALNWMMLELLAKPSLWPEMRQAMERAQAAIAKAEGL